MREMTQRWKFIDPFKRTITKAIFITCPRCCANFHEYKTECTV